jgi:hypothetical protein
MNFIKWLLAIIAVLVVAFGTFVFSMRHHDGPIEIFAGGPFKSGELTDDANQNWERYADRDTIQLQSLEPPRSRTLWLVVIDNRIFVPSAYMNSRFGKAWKQWPRHAEKDGRALLRIDDRIYERQMIRIGADHQLTPQIIDAMRNKYPGNINVEQVAANDTWLFELAARKSVSGD